MCTLHEVYDMNALKGVRYSPSVRAHVSSPKLLNGFRLHLVLGIKTKRSFVTAKHVDQIVLQHNVKYRSN